MENCIFDITLKNSTSFDNDIKSIFNLSKNVKNAFEMKIT